MKKILTFLLFILVMVTTYAQNYQINFVGAGASTIVDSVKVENLTHGTNINLSGQDTLQLTITTNINELFNTSNNSAHIFPNPMTGNCILDFEATAECKTTITLNDMTGKRILQEQKFLSKGHHTYKLTGINSGIYSLKIESSKYTYLTKLISINATYTMPDIKYIGSTPSIDLQNPVLNIGETKSLKNEKSIISMQYTAGDILKFTGKYGNYRTIIMLVPTQDSTITFNFVACTDADSNHYATIQIGTQIWMAENLKVTHCNNGDSIPMVTNNSQWGALTTKAYCDYNNSLSNGQIYGKLYNWYSVVDTCDIAPIGWHVPSDAEWTTFTDFLINDGYGYQGSGDDIAKSMASTSGWNTSTSTAGNIGYDQASNNSSGFTGLPSGIRTVNGTYANNVDATSWWSTTESTATYAWYYNLNYSNSVVNRYSYYKKNGHSVRCIKD